MFVHGTDGWGLYDLASGEELWRQETDVRDGGWIYGLSLSGVRPDGSRLAVLRGSTLILVDPGTGEELAAMELPEGGSLTRVAFSADSHTLALGADSGRLYFLDVGTLEQVAPSRLVTSGYVADLQLSPDGSILAAMGGDGDVTLFDSSTWRPYGKPVVDGLGWGFLSFTDDSLRIYGQDGHDYELSTDLAAWVAAGCRTANTELTAEESAVLLPGEPVEPTCT